MIITKVMCNKCGCEIPDSINSNFYASFGYGSKHDGQEWSFELCENCLEDIIKTFKYIPGGFKENPYIHIDNEDRQKIFEEYKKTGEFDLLSTLSYEELLEYVGFLSKESINEAIIKNHPDRATI